MSPFLARCIATPQSRLREPIDHTPPWTRMTAGSNYYLLASRQGKKKSHLRFKLSRREKTIECIILTPLSWQLSKPNADAFPKRLAGINKSAYVQTIRLSSRKELIVYATNNFMESCSILMPPMCRLLLVPIVFFDRFRVLFGHVFKRKFSIFDA
jgi:hypothetical protein